jgi:transporter family protein
LDKIKKFMWIVFALLAAFSAAVAITLSKAGLKNVDSSLAFALQSVLILIVAWSVVLVQKGYSGLATIDKRTWIYLGIAGVVTCLSSLFQFRALKLGEAALVSSLERLSLVFAILFAFFFLKEQINWKVIVGAALMIGGAVLIAFSRQAAD